MERNARIAPPPSEELLERTRETVEAAELARRTRGVVLAGVHDWGGCALGSASPRPLAPIANRPLIDYVLDWLRSHGISEICVCANSDTRYLRSHLGRRAEYAQVEFYEDVMPRGPAGCARDAWCGSDCDRMLLVDGTIVPQVDLDRMLQCHHRTAAIASVAVSRHELADGRSETILVPEGVYAFDARVREFIPPRGHCDIKESLLPTLHARGERTMAFETEVGSPRVSDTRTYAEANDWAVEHLCAQPTPPAGFRRVDEALLHESSRIERGARLIGPALIGPDCVIGRDVAIVGPVSLGAQVHVGAEAVVCRSAVWDRCQIGMRARVDRCVVTHGARVRPAAQLRGSVVQGSPFADGAGGKG